jgi:hypothetical protein
MKGLFLCYFVNLSLFHLELHCSTQVRILLSLIFEKAMKICLIRLRLWHGSVQALWSLNSKKPFLTDPFQADKSETNFMSCKDWNLSVGDYRSEENHHAWNRLLSVSILKLGATWSWRYWPIVLTLILSPLSSTDWFEI